MKVLTNKLLIEQDLPTNQKGMLYVPQGKEEFPPIGTVRAIGPDVKDLKVGDRVVFQRTPSTAIYPEASARDEYYGLLVLPEDKILGVIS